jgi:glycosyltransferase involved in cell wall biosynthesis
VQFTGPIPSTDVPARIAHSDGILMPSRREGLPFSLLEAMAASRPVLAARTGAIGELLADGAGTLIDPGEPGQLAAALLRWVDDPEHRLDLAAAGWHRVRCRYTAEHSLQTTWQAWTAALGREPGTTAPRRGP